MTGVTSVAGVGSHTESGPGFPPAIGPAFSRAAAVLGDLAPVLVGASAEPAAGLALRCGPNGDDSFEIAIVDASGAVRLCLGAFAEEEVVAVWRTIGAASGLPLMIMQADGGLRSPFPQIGPLQLGAVRIRRRTGLLGGRRPRFLTRRKTGRLARVPRVHHEREIIAGRGA